MKRMISFILLLLMLCTVGCSKKEKPSYTVLNVTYDKSKPQREMWILVDADITERGLRSVLKDIAKIYSRMPNLSIYAYTSRYRYRYRKHVATFNRIDGVDRGILLCMWRREAAEATDIAILIEYLKAYSEKDLVEDAKLIIEKLREIGTPAIPALIEAMKDKDRNVQLRATTALGEMGAIAIPALLEALEDEDASVRGHAALALGVCSVKDVGILDMGVVTDPKVVPALIEALKDKDWNVRWSAVVALGWLKDKGAVPALEEALYDRDPYVRAQASVSLNQIKSEEEILRHFGEFLKEKRQSK